jgi:hypothetical protein
LWFSDWKQDTPLRWRFAMGLYPTVVDWRPFRKQGKKKCWKTGDV